MNGLIVVNKEKGMTSHDVVNKIRKIFNTKKVGHLGTLDPLATGVLVICLNDATKLVQFLQDHDKKYIATVCLGKCTDTYDLEGSVTTEETVTSIEEKLIDNVLASFKGRSKQVPPLYSAIKVDGKKLYEYARNNIVVEVPTRDINIYDIKRVSKLNYVDGCCYFDIEVFVSKGTFIRSLCFDIGKRLNLPSLMADLKRISLGNFELNDASTIEEIEKGNYQVFSMLKSLEEFVQLENDELIKKATSGMKISIKMIKELLDNTPSQIVIKKDDKLIAIYELDLERYCYKAVRVWS